MNETKRLYRVEKGSMIAGVCGGIAEYFNIDPSLVRIAAAALFFAGTLSFWVTWYAPSSCPRRAIYTPDIDIVSPACPAWAGGFYFIRRGKIARGAVGHGASWKIITCNVRESVVE